MPQNGDASEQAQVSWAVVSEAAEQKSASVKPPFVPTREPLFDYVGWLDALAHLPRPSISELACTHTPDARFIGRAAELNSLRKLLQAGKSCALVGAAGVGKTALAAQALCSAQLTSMFEDGIFWLDAGELDMPALLGELARWCTTGPLRSGRTAGATGPLRLNTGDMETQASALRGWFSGKRVLIVLDHVQDPTIAEQFSQVVRTQSLFISRLPISLPESPTIILGPLSDLEASDLVRIHIGDPGVRHDLPVRHPAGHEDRISKICSELANNPLALRLAASCLRVGNVRPATLLGDIRARRPAFSQNDPQSAGGDEALSIQISFELLYRALSEEQRGLWATCGVFAGTSFSATAVAAISGKWRQRTDLWLKRVQGKSESAGHAQVGDLYRENVEQEWTGFVGSALDQLTELGLLDALQGGRYALPPALGQWAREKLDTDWVATSYRALAYYHSFLQQNAALEGSNQLIAPEHRNLLGVLRWAGQQQAWDEVIECACLLEPFWQAAGYWRDADQCLNLALEGSVQVGNISAEQRIHQCLGTNAFLQEGYEEADTHYRRSLTLAVAAGDQRAAASALHALGNVAYRRGDYAQASDYYQHGLAKREALADEAGIASLLYGLGRIHQRSQDYAGAREYYERSLEISERIGNSTAVAYLLHQLGMIAQTRGAYQEAETFYRRSLAIKEQLRLPSGGRGDSAGMARSWYQLGCIYVAQGKLDLAHDQFQKSAKAAAELSDDLVKARSWHALGNIAYQRGAYARAQEFYRQSLLVEESLEDKVGIAANLHAIGMILHEQGNYEQAREHYLRSLEIAAQGAAATYHQLGNIEVSQGDFAAAHQHYSHSLQLSRANNDKPGISAALHQLGVIAQSQGHHHIACQYYERSLEISQELEDKPGVAATLHQLGILSLDQGDCGRARRHFAYSLKIRESLGDKRGILHSLQELGNIQMQSGELVQAGAYYQRSLALAEEIGDKRGVARALTQSGMLAYHHGDYEHAKELYLRSLGIQGALGEKLGISHTLHQLGMVFHLQGNYVEADEYYHRALVIERDLGDRRGEAATLHQAGIMQAEQGGYAKAQESYQQSLEIAQDIGDLVCMSAAFYSLGTLAFERGSYVEAEEYYVSSLQIREHLGDRLNIAAIYHQQALLRMAEGDVSEAEKLHQQSLRLATELDSRYWIALNSHNLGNIACQRQDYAQARDYYQRSLKIHQDTGNLRDAAHALHQLGVVAHASGALEEATDYYGRSLQLKEGLGDRAGMAASLAQLGLLAKGQDVALARNRWRESLSIYASLGLPQAETVRSWLSALPAGGEQATELSDYAALWQ